MAIEDGFAAIDLIADKIADFYDEHGTSPTKIKLPARLACQLVKAREHLGKNLFASIRKQGIRSFGKKGFYGMNVELVSGKDAALTVE